MSITKPFVEKDEINGTLRTMTTISWQTQKFYKGGESLGLWGPISYSANENVNYSSYDDDKEKEMIVTLTLLVRTFLFIY